jgi:hypothetical protein
VTFKAYVETPHRDWTIQQTWRTSADRPGPDGFDRVAVKGSQRVPQGLSESWAGFTRRLDVLDGHLVPPSASRAPFLRGKAPAPKVPPPSLSAQPLFPEVI